MERHNVVDFARILGVEENIMQAARWRGHTRVLAECRVEWNPRLRRAMGRCTGHYRIQINPTLKQDPNQLRDTFLHEFAHAVVPHAKHGMEWKAVARTVGANPESKGASKAIRAEAKRVAKWILKCEGCGVTDTRMRLPKNNPHGRIHKGCGGRIVFTENHERGNR